MQQRVNLARALAVDPDILLMDEPFAALDAQTRDLMQSELLRICQTAQKTVLFITHQVSEAVYLSDCVAVMSARPGEIKAQIRIDWPHPRSSASRRNTTAIGYEQQIWELLQPESAKAMEAISGPATNGGGAAAL
jgi:NitT/TauT family transport system ATP-binding protein